MNNSGLEGWDIELINVIKRKLSVKVFLITFFLLMVACCGTFLCILRIMPTSYLKTLNQDAEKKSLQLIETLSAFDNVTECMETISKFEIEAGVSVWLDDQNGNTVYPTDIIEGGDTVYYDAYVTYNENEDDFPFLTERSSQTFPLAFNNGDSYTLTVFTDLFVVQQSTDVLISIFPYVLLMVVGLSFLCSFFYSRFITKPILQLSSRTMADRHMRRSACWKAGESEVICLRGGLRLCRPYIGRMAKNFRPSGDILRLIYSRFVQFMGVLCNGV